MTTKDLIQIWEFIAKVNNPVLSLTFLLIVVFSLFMIARKFITNEYVTAGKEAFAEQKSMHDELKANYDKLKIKNEELEKEVNELRERITSLEKERKIWLASCNE